jgi:L-seryl-tRNA(Ser) seleniumtransferase
MHQLAETKPVGIGSLNADAGGMRGRNPNPPPANQPERRQRRQQDPTKFGFAMWQLKEGEDKYIADRLVEIFSAAPKA